MDYEIIQKETKEKFASLDFKPGDLFSEHLSVFKLIVGVDQDKNLMVFEGHPNDVGNLELNKYTPEEFKNKCSYDYTDGYWIDLISTDYKKTHEWIEIYSIYSDANKRRCKILNILLD